MADNDVDKVVCVRGATVQKVSVWFENMLFFSFFLGSYCSTIFREFWSMSRSSTMNDLTGSKWSRRDTMS